MFTTIITSPWPTPVHRVIDESFDTVATLGGTEILVVHDRGNTTNDELWRTDGTAEGTVLIGQFEYIGLGHAFNGRYVFHAEPDINRPQLWATDGTEVGTALVTSLWELPIPNVEIDDWQIRAIQSNVPPTSGDASSTIIHHSHEVVYDFTTSGDQLYFVTRYAGTLVRTDGTTAGTHVVYESDENWPSLRIQPTDADTILIEDEDAYFVTNAGSNTLTPVPYRLPRGAYGTFWYGDRLVRRNNIPVKFGAERITFDSPRLTDADVKADLQLEPVSVKFSADGRTLAATLRVTNVGNATGMTSRDWTMKLRDDAGENLNFTTDAARASFYLAAGKSKTITLRFKPTWTEGPSGRLAVEMAGREADFGPIEAPAAVRTNVALSNVSLPATISSRARTPIEFDLTNHGPATVLLKLRLTAVATPGADAPAGERHRIATHEFTVALRPGQTKHVRAPKVIRSPYGDGLPFVEVRVASAFYFDETPADNAALVTATLLDD